MERRDFDPFLLRHALLNLRVARDLQLADNLFDWHAAKRNLEHRTIERAQARWL
jgi:hypothetical protein